MRMGAMWLTSDDSAVGQPETIRFCHFSLRRVLSLSGAFRTFSPLPGFAHLVLLKLAWSGIERYGRSHPHILADYV
jgi:hypothetical protein